MDNLISYAKFIVTLVCEEKAILPAYLGSTLRGALGYGLKNICCTGDITLDCRQCVRKAECKYTYMFCNLKEEDQGWMKSIDTKPNPFVIEPPIDGCRTFNPGDKLVFNIILFGDCINNLPYFVLAIEGMAQRGFTPKKHRFKLKEIKDFYTSSIVYDDGKLYLDRIKSLKWNSNEQIKACGPISEISIKFITPFRFSYMGRLADSLSFEILMRSILRRASIISSIYCDSTWQFDFENFLEETRRVSVKKADLRWHDWERYSNRARSRIKMGGIVGDITFKGRLEPFKPYIDIGSILHIGKGCTMGLGKYEWKEG